MVQLVVFINLFFVPMLPLYIIYRKRKRPLEPNVELLFQYGIAAVCNIPLTKVMIFLIKKIARKHISIDSGYYTVAALLSTVLVALLYQFFSSFCDGSYWKNELLPQNSGEAYRAPQRMRLTGELCGIFVITIELFIMFLMSFPRVDDLTWGSSVGIERLSEWFAGYNGRYVGNLIVIILTRLPAGIRACVEIAILYTLLYYVRRLLPRKGAFCFFALAFLSLPLSLFAQSVVWTSGFANFTTSAVAMLYVMQTYYRIVIREEKLSRIGYIVFLIISFLGQLIVENTTIYTVVLAVCFLLIGWIKDRKVYAPVAAGLISALCGAALMFQNSSYHSALVGDGGNYKSIGLAPLKLWNKYKNVIVPDLIQSNHILNLALSIILLLLWLTKDTEGKKQKISWSNMLWTYCGVALIAFFSYDMVEGTWTSAFAWGRNAYAAVSFLYAAYIIATILSAVDKNEGKLTLLIFAVSQVVLAAPLAAANPVSIRCFFQNDILWAMMVGSMLQILLERRGWDFDRVGKERVPFKLAKLTQIICISYLAFMLCGQSQSWHIQKIRQEMTQSCVENGAETIVLPKVPYSGIYAFGANSYTNKYWLTNYKRYYNIPMDTNLKFIDYNKWLAEFGEG